MCIRQAAFSAVFTMIIIRTFIAAITVTADHFAVGTDAAPFTGRCGIAFTAPHAMLSFLQSTLHAQIAFFAEITAIIAGAA